MDALYFEFSRERQTIVNRFDDLLTVADHDGSGHGRPRIRRLLSDCVCEEQGRSGKAEASRRPLLE